MGTGTSVVPVTCSFCPLTVETCSLFSRAYPLIYIALQICSKNALAADPDFKHDLCTGSTGSCQGPLPGAPGSLNMLDNGSVLLTVH